MPGNSRNISVGAVIGTLSQLRRNYRNVLGKMDIGYYYKVLSSAGPDGAVVFRASFWDEEDTDFIDLNSQHMNKNSIFFMNIARHWQVNLRISAAKRRYYLLEPQLTGFEHIARRLGRTVPEIRKMILAGPIGAQVTEENKRLETLLKSKDQEFGLNVKNEAARLAQAERTELAELRQKIAQLQSRLEGEENQARIVAVYRRRLADNNLPTSIRPSPGE